MPKHLIALVGLIISVGVVALGVLLVGLPIYLQSVAVDAQTASVAGTNAAYQAQVERLREEQERQAEIDAAVAELRAQIPEAPRLDDAFEVIARSAETTGVTIESITAGTAVDYVERTDPGEGDTGAAPAVEQATTEDLEAGDAGTDAGDGTGTPVVPEESSGSQQQIDFTITVVAADITQVTAFLDAMRAGPRLVTPLTVAVTETEPGKFVLNVGSLTFVDLEA